MLMAHLQRCMTTNSLNCTGVAPCHDYSAALRPYAPRLAGTREPRPTLAVLRMSRVTACGSTDSVLILLWTLESIGCGDSACRTLRRDLGAMAWVPRQASAMVNRRVPFPSSVPQRSFALHRLVFASPPPLLSLAQAMARPARCSLRTSRAPVWRRLGRRTQRDWRLRADGEQQSRQWQRSPLPCASDPPSPDNAGFPTRQWRRCAAVRARECAACVRVWARARSRIRTRLAATQGRRQPRSGPARPGPSRPGPASPAQPEQRVAGTRGDRQPRTGPGSPATRPGPGSARARTGSARDRQGAAFWLRYSVGGTAPSSDAVSPPLSLSRSRSWPARRGRGRRGRRGRPGRRGGLRRARRAARRARQPD
jgi:hypothetical protein